MSLHPGQPTVPCQWCGRPTPMVGTQCCDNCWEMSSRIQAYPLLARKMLGALGPIWVTKDGRRIPVTDMETAHIENTLAMLKRKGWCSPEEFTSAWCSLGMCRGEMATYYAEQAVVSMKPAKIVGVLEDELLRRKS